MFVLIKKKFFNVEDDIDACTGQVILIHIDHHVHDGGRQKRP